MVSVCANRIIPWLYDKPHSFLFTRTKDQDIIPSVVHPVDGGISMRSAS